MGVFAALDAGAPATAAVERAQGARLIMAGVSAVTFLAVWRVPRPGALDAIDTAWWLANAMLLLVLNASRGADVGLVLASLFLVACYLPRRPLPQRVLVPMVFGVAQALVLALGSAPLPASPLALAMLFVLANVLGLFAARSRDRELALRFHASHAQERDPLRSLIIPVCSHCGDVRLPSTGAWSSALNLLAELSAHPFSHGFCDNCLDEHYPDLVTDD